MVLCSLVIPVYRNEENISDLIAALEDVADHTSELEVVFVVDGSPDRSAATLAEQLPNAPFAWQLVELSRNFGSFAAIRQGLALARGQFFAVMAADLQEPPELVVRFFNELKSQRCDLVVGVRAARSDPFFTRMTSALYWRLYRMFIMPQVPTNGVDVFACNSKFREALLTLEERSSFLIGQLFWLGFRRREMTYDRRPRTAGRSAWTFRRRLAHMLDSLFAFSDLPITILLWLGAIGMTISVAASLMVVLAWSLGWVDVRGYVPIMLALMFFGFLQVLGQGIVGCYIWRVSENTKKRPLSIILSHRASSNVPIASEVAEAN
jgi:glycosyltransferase involved in cell wall biosynthesis